jgi:hypothetical protein
MENNPHDTMIVSALNKLSHGRRGDTVNISAEAIRCSSLTLSTLVEMLNFEVVIVPDPSGTTITRSAKKAMTRGAETARDLTEISSRRSSCHAARRPGAGPAFTRPRPCQL